MTDDGTAADAELLLAWRDGDEAQGRVLFRRYVGRVARFFQSKRVAEVDDLVQQTFLECVKSADKLRDAERFRGFLFGIARHVMFGHFKRRRSDDDRLDPATVSIAELATSVGTKMARAEDQQILLDALQQSPVDDQIVIELHYWEGMTTAEIADALEIPAGTVKGRLQRARARLAKAVEARRGDPVRIESTLDGLGRLPPDP